MRPAAICWRCTSSRSGLRAIRTPKSSCRRCCSPRSWRSRARRWTTTGSSRRSRRSLLGLLLFLRFDAVSASARVLRGARAVSAGTPRPSGLVWPFFAVLLASPLAAPYLLGPMRAYARLPIVFLGNAWWQHPRSLPAALIGACSRRRPHALGALGRVRRTRRRCRRASSPRPLYALYFREPVRHARGARRLRAADVHRVLPHASGAPRRTVGFALWRAARSGAPGAVHRRRGVRLFFFYKIRIVPEHFWMARRFLPVILPGRCCSRRRRAGGTERRVRVAPAARATHRPRVHLLLAMQYARAARPVLRPRRVSGRDPRLEALAARSATRPAGRRVARRLGHARARRYHWRTSTPGTCCCSAPPAGQGGLSRSSSTGRGRATTACSSSAEAARTCSRRRGACAAIASERFQLPEYDASRVDAYPTFVRHKEFDYSVYELTLPRPGSGPAALRSRRRRQRRPARRALPREGTDRGPIVPLVARSLARVSVAD